MAFWETLSLSEMNDEQWESLCDGCGKCCLHKLIDEDVEESYHSADTSGQAMYFTNVCCQYLDQLRCTCTQYQARTELVPHCIKLTKANLAQVDYMPPSCAYRLLHERKTLPSWHPLRHNGSKQMMHQANASVRFKVISEAVMPEAQWEECIVRWPLA